MSLTEALLQGSELFILIQIFLIVLILILAIRKAFLYYGNKGPKELPFHRSHNFILFLGIFAFAFGFFEQLVGMIQALNAIIEAADVSPALIIQGLKRSLMSPTIGFSTLLGAAIIWAVLHGKYTSALKQE